MHGVGDGLVEGSALRALYPTGFEFPLGVIHVRGHHLDVERIASTAPPSGGQFSHLFCPQRFSYLNCPVRSGGVSPGIGS
jgi:hypothetical protein